MAYIQKSSNQEASIRTGKMTTKTLVSVKNRKYKTGKQEKARKIIWPPQKRYANEYGGEIGKKEEVSKILWPPQPKKYGNVYTGEVPPIFVPGNPECFYSTPRIADKDKHKNVLLLSYDKSNEGMQPMHNRYFNPFVTNDWLTVANQPCLSGYNHFQTIEQTRQAQMPPGVIGYVQQYVPVILDQRSQTQTQLPLVVAGDKLINSSSVPSVFPKPSIKSAVAPHNVARTLSKSKSINQHGDSNSPLVNVSQTGIKPPYFILLENPSYQTTLVPKTANSFNSPAARVSRGQKRSTLHANVSESSLPSASLNLCDYAKIQKPFSDTRIVNQQFPGVVPNRPLSMERVALMKEDMSQVLQCPAVNRSPKKASQYFRIKETSVEKSSSTTDTGYSESSSSKSSSTTQIVVNPAASIALARPRVLVPSDQTSKEKPKSKKRKPKPKQTTKAEMAYLERIAKARETKAEKDKMPKLYLKEKLPVRYMGPLMYNQKHQGQKKRAVPPPLKLSLCKLIKPDTPPRWPRLETVKNKDCQVTSESPLSSATSLIDSVEVPWESMLHKRKVAAARRIRFGPAPIRFVYGRTKPKEIQPAGGCALSSGRVSSLTRFVVPGVTQDKLTQKKSHAAHSHPHAQAHSAKSKPVGKAKRRTSTASKSKSSCSYTSTKFVELVSDSELDLRADGDEVEVDPNKVRLILEDGTPVTSEFKGTFYDKVNDCYFYYK